MSGPDSNTAAEAEATAGNSFGEMSDDALMDAVNTAAVETPDPIAEPVTDEPVVEEEEAATEQSEAQPEGDEADETDAPTQTEADGQPEVEPEAEDLRQLKLDEAVARAKHFESVAGRNSGKLGFVQKKLEKLEQLVATQQPLADRGEYEQPGYQEPAPRPQAPTVNPNDQYHSDKAGKDSFVEFTKDNPSVYVEVDGKAQLDPAFVQHLQSRGDDIRSAMSSGDASFAAGEIKSIMRESLSITEVARAQAKREEAERRSAVQSKKLLDAKKAQAAASVGTRPATKPKSKPTSFKQVKTADLAAAIDARAGLD